MPFKQQNSRSRTAARQNTDFSKALALILEHAQPTTALLIKLLATTGITPKELTELQTTDIKERTLILRAETTKNNTPRTILLPQSLARELATKTRTLKPQEHLFSTRQSPKVTTRRVEQLLKEASNKAGVNITPRDLRKAYLATAAKHAKNDQELRALTGILSITKKQTLTQTQQQRITELNLEPRERALINLLLTTGITLTEALELTPQHIKEQELVLHDRSLPLSHTLAQQLKTLARQPDSHLFTSRQSQQLSVRRAEQLITSIGVRARIPLTSTLLRATAIQEIAQTHGEQEARKRAGINSPITYTYGTLGGERT